ncbi:MFS transporter [Armillaria borealis]|uniref:MFS transporter n=1 Tax=Armillaria borealis TaxID=47425 RepID=A0AA39MIZ0_9AGAR|nr:MFS transporter [Armillaria borealis]
MFGWGATEMIMAISQSYSRLLGLRFLLGVFQAAIRSKDLVRSHPWYDIHFHNLDPSVAHLGEASRMLLDLWTGTGVSKLGDGYSSSRAHRHVYSRQSFYLFLPSYPEKAGWLSPDHRALAMLRMTQETSESLGHITVTWRGGKSTLGDWRLYLHYLVSILVSVTMTSVVVFSPTIADGMGYEGRDAQLFTVPPFALASFITVTTSWVADRYRMWSTWSMFTGNLRDTNATTLAIPMNVAFATFEERIGMFIYKPVEAPAYPTGHFTSGAVLFAGAICIGALRVIYKKRNRELTVGECPWIA